MSEPQDGSGQPQAMGSSFSLSPVPLFPLPNVILFPRAVLPLHIFEERYKAMTADALRGERLVAMALLRPGWERDYYHKPAVAPVVCVGRIVSHERLPDGKYNFLLRGEARARIVRETSSQAPYRLAELEPLPETNAAEADLAPQRDRLARLFRPSLLGSTPVGRQFSAMLSAEGVRTADVADLVAFNFLDDVGLKQSLLEEGDVLARVRRTIDALEATRPALQTAQRHGFSESGIGLN